MSAKYNVIPRGNPSDPDAPKKYYPSFTSSSKISLRRVAEEIASISTLSTIDTVAVLEAFLMIVPRHLANGNIVDLGDFGSFRLKIKSDGSDTPDAVSARNITNILPHFLPGKPFKQVISKTEFKKA